jgi:hypothetical protein
MKPMPVCSMAAATCSGCSSIAAPSASSVGAAGLGRHAAVAVLGHARTGRGGHEHRAGGDVEGVRAIAAGADDVDQVVLSATGTAARIRASRWPRRRSRRWFPSSRAGR